MFGAKGLDEGMAALPVSMDGDKEDSARVSRVLKGRGPETY